MTPETHILREPATALAAATVRLVAAIPLYLSALGLAEARPRAASANRTGLAPERKITMQWIGAFLLVLGLVNGSAISDRAETACVLCAVGASLVTIKIYWRLRRAVREREGY